MLDYFNSENISDEFRNLSYLFCVQKEPILMLKYNSHYIYN